MIGVSVLNVIRPSDNPRNSRSHDDSFESSANGMMQLLTEMTEKRTSQGRPPRATSMVNKNDVVTTEITNGKVYQSPSLRMRAA